MPRHHQSGASCRPHQVRRPFHPVHQAFGAGCSRCISPPPAPLRWEWWVRLVRYPWWVQYRTASTAVPHRSLSRFNEATTPSLLAVPVRATSTCSSVSMLSPVVIHGKISPPGRACPAPSPDLRPSITPGDWWNVASTRPSTLVLASLGLEMPVWGASWWFVGVPSPTRLARLGRNERAEGLAARPLPSGPASLTVSMQCTLPDRASRHVDQKQRQGCARRYPTTGLHCQRPGELQLPRA